MWQKIKEFPILVGINLIVSIKYFIEFLKVAKRYYSNKNFRKADLALLRKYILKNPFKIHKRFMEERGEVDVYQYGETFLTSMDTMLKETGVTQNDRYLELGCGRGRTCFWVRCVLDLPTEGIDYVPAFIEIAQKVVEEQHLTGITFRCEDFNTCDWGNPTVIYIDATLTEGYELGMLIKKFESVPKGTKVIGVNLPLPHKMWTEKKTFTVPFPWGDATAVIFEKR